MEPIPETVEAINELDPSADPDGNVLANLIELANRGQEIVPDLVGVSIGLLDHGLTFTLVATAEEISLFDAIQYLAGGPCVDGAHTNEVIEFNRDDGLNEEDWQLFAEVTAERAVRSSLTLPLVSGGSVTGTVNLYAASLRAFEGHHDVLAQVFGAWATGAVANADLSFMTRRNAQAAPQKLRDQIDIDVATGIVAAQLGLDVAAASARLLDAATRAGVSLLEIARGIIGARKRGRDEI
jgi:GAF domain-containing protein